jgi:hypothetical protein
MTARLRHLVLATDNLAAAAAAAQSWLGVAPGIADAEAMLDFDLEHEILVLGSAYLEIVAPLGNRPELPGAKFLARHGPGGYMLDLQVPDLEEILTEAAKLGIEPVLRDVYRENYICQLHPRDFGTLLEVDQNTGGRDWHWDAEFSPAQRSAERALPVAAQLAVPDPAQMAHRWARVFGGDLAVDTNSVLLNGVTISFVAAAGSPTGLASVDVQVPADVEPGEQEIAGVIFRRRRGVTTTDSLESGSTT